VANSSPDEMDDVTDILEDWPAVPHNASDVSKKMHKYVMALVRIVKDQSTKIKELETKLASTEAGLQAEYRSDAFLLPPSSSRGRRYACYVLV